MIDLLDALQRDMDELSQFLNAYDDAIAMPGRRQSGMDADGGRQATHGPNRPTEATALDERRTALRAELKNGAAWLPRAVAIVRGVTASMDRALALWEGEETVEVPGGLSSDHHNRPTRH
jgi:hypothetical protein